MILRLRERGLRYYRLNADELASTGVTMRVDAGGVTRRLATKGASVDLEEVGCVWYRRAIRPGAPHTVLPKFGNFAAAELRHLYEGLVADPALRWVNPFEASDLAERKLYQLRIAAECGLLPPPTIVSNDASALDAFSAAEDRVICKPISQGLLTAEGECFAVHTREIPATSWNDAGDIGGLPLLMQRLVPKGTDIRLTIIGNDGYSVEVHTPGGGPIDWRAAASGIEYRTCDLPGDVERGCRAMMSRLGICYGAFGFVRTDEGEWYFLEVNPAGEWAWLEVELGVPMRDSFIKLFHGS